MNIPMFIGGCISVLGGGLLTAFVAIHTPAPANIAVAAVSIIFLVGGIGATWAGLTGED